MKFGKRNIIYHFFREFDNNHIKWIVEHDSEPSNLGIFAAYEKLDNIDYANLLNLVRSIGINEPGALIFYIIHSNANHFERLNSNLKEMWKKDREEIIIAFHFIYITKLRCGHSFPTLSVDRFS